jgi:hypothetical protein
MYNYSFRDYDLTCSSNKCRVKSKSVGSIIVMVALLQMGEVSNIIFDNFSSSLQLSYLLIFISAHICVSYMLPPLLSFKKAFILGFTSTGGETKK